MYAQHIIRDPIYFDTFPMIEREFDRFEIDNDLETQLRHAETANFYHDALNEAE